MEIHEFAGKVSTALQEELGTGYTVDYRDVRKNNGVTLCGLLVTSGERNVAPTIYLEDYLEAYGAGRMDLEEVVRRIAGTYMKNAAVKDIDMEFFKSFEGVKDRICYRLVGREANRELLQDVAHVKYLDMAVCFFYAFRDESLGEGSILVKNGYMEHWGTDVGELMGLAMENTPRLFPWTCNSMDEILSGILEDCGPEECEGDAGLPELPMQVLSNQQQLNGAACVLYPGVLEQVAGRMRTGFYILPSSIHEVILMPDTGDLEPGTLEAMVAQVNATQVQPEDILTDSLYYYDPERKRMEKL